MAKSGHSKSKKKKPTPSATAKADSKKKSPQVPTKAPVSEKKKPAQKAAKSEGKFSFLSPTRLRSFMRDVQGEMRKVAWPSRKQLAASTSAVLVAIVILGVYIGVLDYIFDRLAKSLGL